MKKALIYSLISSTLYSQMLFYDKGSYFNDEFIEKKDIIILKEGHCLGIKYKIEENQTVKFSLKNKKNKVFEGNSKNSGQYIYCFKENDLNQTGIWTFSLNRKNEKEKENVFSYIKTIPFENNISDVNLSEMIRAL